MRLIVIGSITGPLGVATRIASDRGARVRNVADVTAALESLRAGQGADLILAEVKQNIRSLVESLKAERFAVPVVACGADGDATAAAASIRAGAKEDLPLPPDEALIAAVLEAITDEGQEVIGKAPAMQKTLQMVEQIAPSQASVLITGESGTGKEVISRLIHQRSNRANKEFISINCAAIPENLLESELFGHEKGAFTGAVARRIGKFEEADGGTLLLDEISEMDSRLQAKLLRAIQEREIVRVGGDKPVKLDIRILATSNRDLQQCVREGKFREDLYFRLNVITLHLPPLRERKEDIPNFAAHFAKKYAEANGVPERKLTKDAVKKLETYDWPGNVRELENTLHRAVLLATGAAIDAEAILLTEELLAGGRKVASGGSSLVGRTVESVEEELILNTVDHCLGDHNSAARILGISIQVLRNKLKGFKGSGK